MQIIFVLVRPAVPENIGAAARALKTMGFIELRIVGTVAHREKQARILAHASTDILDNAQEFSDLSAALADIDFSVATSAKDRHDRRYSFSPPELRANLIGKQGAVKKVAIVFGCEESGLSNGELALCDALSSVPLATSYPSLNLAQAVMLYAYELSACATLTENAVPESAEWAALKQRITPLLDSLAVPDGKLRD
ncbi:MAG: tRNA/rRNA methyltransferase, partial [Spongiibacteraceae bacterium]